MKYLLIIFLLLSTSVYASESIYGTWVVVDSKFVGISAMDLEEAKTWYGNKAIYSKNRASFRDDECSKPVYKTEICDKDDFHFRFRASFQELGLEGEKVEIIVIGCPDNWIAPGSLIIKVNNDHVYTIWDGVFFLLEKQKNP